ncbi:MAG: class I SAM-dependent methyltransferase [Spirochaetes bacterium]|nr:class I SAM-dependent methyltransferase [Spirochaetota bacterium]
MPKIDPFEKFYNEYDNWFDENKIIYKTEIDAVKKLLPKGRGIEIGIGTGRFAYPLGIEIGIEPSPKMREIAVKRGLNAIDGTAENIPFSDNEFDFALLVTTLCFLDNVDEAFKEIHRILKPSGSIIIAFIDKESPVGKIYLEKKENDPFYKAAEFYSADEVIYHLSLNKFSKFKVIQTIFGSLDMIKKIQRSKNGHGKGSFVVIRANK